MALNQIPRICFFFALLWLILLCLLIEAMQKEAEAGKSNNFRRKQISRIILSWNLRAGNVPDQQDCFVPGELQSYFVCCHAIVTEIEPKMCLDHWTQIKLTGRFFFELSDISNIYPNQHYNYVTIRTNAIIFLDQNSNVNCKWVNVTDTTSWARPSRWSHAVELTLFPWHNYAIYDTI